MIIEIKDESGADIEIFQSLPSGMEKLNIRGSDPTFLQGNAFQILMQAFNGDGFVAWYNRFWNDEDKIITARGDVPFLELRIGLVEQLEGTWENIKEAPLKPRHFNFTFNPHVKTRAIFRPEKYCATFDIHITEPLLRKIGIDYKELDKFFKKIRSSKPAELSPFAHECPLEMIDSINFILNNPYSLKAQKNFLNNHISNIVTIALETIASPDHPLPVNLTNRNIEGLHEIKQFIKESIPEWSDYKKLCQKGEINEFKLKVGFKYLFKMSPYEYHMKLKFREAKRMLAEKAESISAIAYKLGYEHHQSFTKEFTSRFGYPPVWYQENFHRLNDDDNFLSSM